MNEITPTPGPAGNAEHQTSTSIARGRMGAPPDFVHETSLVGDTERFRDNQIPPSDLNSPVYTGVDYAWDFQLSAAGGYVSPYTMTGAIWDDWA